LVHRTITYLFLKWDGWEWEVRSGLVVRDEDVAEPYLVASRCDTMNLTKKWREKYLELKKLDSPYYNLPVHTRDTCTGTRYAKCAKSLPYPYRGTVTQSPRVFPYRDIPSHLLCMHNNAPKSVLIARCPTIEWESDLTIPSPTCNSVSSNFGMRWEEITAIIFWCLIWYPQPFS